MSKSNSHKKQLKENTSVVYGMKRSSEYKITNPILKDPKLVAWIKENAYMYTYKEMAEELGVTIGQLNNAMKKLKVKSRCSGGTLAEVTKLIKGLEK